MNVDAKKLYHRNLPALVNVQVVLDFRVAPVSQVLGMIINLKNVKIAKGIQEHNRYAYGVEPVPTDEGNRVGQNRTTDSVARAYAHTGNHGFFSSLCDETGVEFDEVRMLVQVSELIRHSLTTGKYVCHISPGINRQTSSGLNSSNLS